MARRIVSSAFVSLPEPAIAVVEDNFVLFASVIVGAFFLSSSRSKELGYWGYLIRQKLLGVGLPIRPWCLAETLQPGGSTILGLTYLSSGSPSQRGATRIVGVMIPCLDNQPTTAAAMETSKQEIQICVLPRLFPLTRICRVTSGVRKLEVFLDAIYHDYILVKS